MEIVYKQSGGVGYFPGLQDEVRINSTDLPESAAAELERLVAAANFRDLPEPPATISSVTSTARDYQEETVTIDGHTVQFVGSPEDPDQQALLNALRPLVKAQRAAARTRSARQDTPEQE
jgi:hypothetical protein